MNRCPLSRRSVCYGLLALAMLACRPKAAPPGADPRIALALPADAAAAVRTEMRTMLGSLHTILAAPPGDTATIHQAALASGMAAAADPALEPLLPPAFLTMGAAVHGAFDSLAASPGMPRDSVVARLGRLTATCVSCHATYRLAPP